MQRLVSHELRTPLASIGGLAGTLERYRMSEQELRRVAALIRRESDRLRDMVTDFLELERLGAGAHRTLVDLRRLVRDRLEVLAPMAAERDQRLDLGADSPALVEGDPDLLGRVVDNLVANAITYSDAGTAIRLEITAGPDAVQLEVADEGPGIPAEALPRLFERFFRVPGTEPPGSGLGLALVHEVVGWHGGCIDVRSEPGTGTTFTVRLPTAGGGEEDEHDGTDPGHR
jgi:signal transduction histidine kinase